MKEYVDSLIRAEMSTFSKSSGNYLAHLPYPTLKFTNNPALQVKIIAHDYLYIIILMWYLCLDRSSTNVWRVGRRWINWTWPDIMWSRQPHLRKRMSWYEANRIEFYVLIVIYSYVRPFSSILSVCSRRGVRQWVTLRLSSSTSTTD